MSYTFYVTCNSATKKVTCLPGTTINDLAALSIEKFKLPPDTNACLLHKGKALDGMLLIRLANLINNAKLDLVRVELSEPVQLKIVGMCLGKSLTKILTVNRSISVADLITQFFKECGEDIDWTKYSVELSAIQSRILNSSADFSAATVASLVGLGSNASLRLLVEDLEAKRLKEMAQREQQQLRREQERQKIKDMLIKKDEGSSTAPQPFVPPPTKAITKPKPEPVQEAELKNSLSENLFDSAATEKLLSLGSLLPNALHESLTSDTPSDSAWRLPQDTQDTLYIPKGHLDTYDNPDDDYNFTTRHAETYLKVIQGMQQPHKKIATQAPTRYTIRLRFPDRSLLDLVMEDSAVRLGQLFKKIDSYVHPKFINTYTLKNGAPPFEKIQLGFSHNNKLLKDHPLFQQEKLLLVWEPEANLPGPYLNGELKAKNIIEIPAAKLESSRQNLPDDNPNQRKSAHSKIEKTKSEKRSGMPKWFRR